MAERGICPVCYAPNTPPGPGVDADTALVQEPAGADLPDPKE